MDHGGHGFQESFTVHLAPPEIDTCGWAEKMASCRCGIPDQTQEMMVGFMG